MQVLKYGIADAEVKEGWGKPGDGLHGSDLVDAKTHPQARMTVGFTRVDDGERMRAAFPYDEVMVLLQGSVMVEPETGEPFTAHRGDVVYMPQGSTNTYVFQQGFEAAYVASPPSVYAQHVINTSYGR